MFSVNTKLSLAELSPRCFQLSYAYLVGDSLTKAHGLLDSAQLGFLDNPIMSYAIDIWSS